MVVLKLSKNGTLLCTAGAADLGILNANIVASGVLGEAAMPVRPDQEVELRMHIGGMTSRDQMPDDHLSWNSGSKLNIGDVVEIEFVEADVADVPDSVRPDDHEKSTARLKEKYEYAKAFYFQFKEKFENGQR